MHRTLVGSTIALVVVGALCLVIPAEAQEASFPGRCAPGTVLSGTVCIDTYEASVWRVPNATTANFGLVQRIRAGKATAADLTAAGATQLGIGQSDDYAPCGNGGQNCADGIYAASLAGVLPSANLTWFQAQAACKNSHKRLPSNAEWQAAVIGTPDPGVDDGTHDCNTASAFAAIATGSRASCVSADGVFDMVGNLFEWVADWLPRSNACGAWNAEVSPTGDAQCLTGTASPGEPGALLRGGFFLGGPSAGPLAILDTVGPSTSNEGIGFRCVEQALPEPVEMDGDIDGVLDGSDNCPFYASPDVGDADGDGRGDACECGDQNGDGRNTVADLVAIDEAIFTPALVTPLCDANSDGYCDVGDILAVNRDLFTNGSTTTCARQPVPGP